MDLFLLYFTSTLFMDCSIKKATRIRDIYPVSRETTNIQKKNTQTQNNNSWITPMKDFNPQHGSDVGIA